MKNKISELIDKKLWLAPLAGFTDNSFRTICKKLGADVVVSEMVSADGLVYNRDKTLKFAYYSEDQHPIGIQIFGSNEKIMAEGAKIILELKPDFIDINMGCPVKKVVKRGAGSALMKNLPIASKIIEAVKKAMLEDKIPLSVKFRSGWDFNSINAIEFAKMAESSGADIICIHPRTRSQMFSGKSDWEIIKRIKENVKIPVIGNGDILLPEDAKRMFDSTGCDSIMIGRGIMGNPWLFNLCKQYLLTDSIQKLDTKSKYKVIKEHFKLTVKDKGLDCAIREMRTHFCHYTKGMRGGSESRNFITRSKNEKEILGEIKRLYYEQS